jgi:hypothetical protein
MRPHLAGVVSAGELVGGRRCRAPHCRERCPRCRHPQRMERERSATERMQGMKPPGHACGRGEIRWAPCGCDFFLPTA